MKKKSVSKEDFRPLFHFSPPKGWLNDPNGFSFYNGKWHLFYQHNPHSTKWGIMYWGHAVSKDLICWEHLPIALKPYSKNDNFLGCFSGSAMEHNDKLFLMYTGVPFFRQHQLLAVSHDGVNFDKLAKPVIGIKNRPPYSGIFSFRDPKIIKQDIFYSLIGASYKKGRQIALYKSTNLINWEFVSAIYKEEGKTRGIFECPDLVLSKNGDILLYSIMYTPTQGNTYQNIHSSVCVVGKADLVAGVFLPTYNIKELDYGCDYYAPQTVTHNGKTIIIAWMQMWFRSNPTDYLDKGYAGIMTLPKEIFVENGVVKQKPIKEIYNYFDIDSIKQDTFIKEHRYIDGIDGECYVLKVEFDSACDLNIDLRVRGDNKTTISYNQRQLIFDRTQSGYAIKGAKLDGDCNIRYCDIGMDEHITMEIFCDKSSVEIIANNQYCMSNTIYPYENSTGVFFSSKSGCDLRVSFSPFKANN